MTNTEKYYAYGKLLISGEYFVLDGALALAIPTQLGQNLTITTESAIEDPLIFWQSKSLNGEVWFEGRFAWNDFRPIEHTDQNIADRIQEVLSVARQLNPDFLNTPQHLEVTTSLDFPRDWGLGTSSTLIQNISDWAKVNPYQLLAHTFGGSGYDIACAAAKGPITFQKINEVPHTETIAFNPPFLNQLYFVYLGKKQNSREGIARYREEVKEQPKLIQQVTTLTQAFIECKTLTDFEDLIFKHEKLVGESIKLPRAKALYFSDYWGEVKSLGAWGGDFVMITSNKDKDLTEKYFKEKGFEVFLRFEDLMLNKN